MDHKFAKVNDITLSYYEEPNEAPKLLFLHGLYESSPNFINLNSFLNGNFHTYVLEMRGNGESSYSDRYNMDDFFQDIKLFIETVIQDKFFLYGHSYGGQLAIRLLYEAPDFIQSTIISDALYMPLWEDYSQMNYVKDQLGKIHQLKVNYKENDPPERKIDVLTEFFGEESRNEIKELISNPPFDIKLVFDDTKELYDLLHNNYNIDDVDRYLSHSSSPVLFLLSSQTKSVWQSNLPDTLITKNKIVHREEAIKKLRPDAHIKTFNMSHNLHVEDPFTISVIIQNYFLYNKVI